MHKFLLIFFLLISQQAYSSDLNFSDFSKIPILHNGRIKPLASFADIQLLTFYGKRSIPAMSSIEWFAELIFNNRKAAERKIFKIRNPQVLHNLGLEIRTNMLYSAFEISTGIAQNESYIQSLLNNNPEDLDTHQNQIIDLYRKVLHFFSLSRSLSMLAPRIVIQDSTLIQKMNLANKDKYTYNDIYPYINDVNSDVKKIISKDRSTLTKRDYELLKIAKEIILIEKDQLLEVFKIIPPAFSNTQNWFTHWQSKKEGNGTPELLKLEALWEDLYNAYNSQDNIKWTNSISQLFQLQPLTQNSSKLKLGLEKTYNDYDFFTISLMFYIFSFITLCLSFLTLRNKLRMTSLLSLALGSAVHATGITIRCLIMQRPPVSSLYESILFVALIIVLFGIIYEVKYKNTLGIIIGTTLSIVLLFGSYVFEVSGDNMGMLSAVLRSNFWLSLHVLTITIGYGCCFILSALSHIWLIHFLLKKSNVQFLNKLNKNIYGATHFSLFFTILGTILGGIWADQSWGRFWGWDPKENGALFLCMWLLMIIHGRYINFISNFLLNSLLALTSVVVAMAWFGVNLLNVGLHSYGFTDKMAIGLFTFAVIEMIFLIIVQFYNIKKKAAIE